MIVWKKAKECGRLGRPVIVKMKVESRLIVAPYNSNKMRAKRVLVLDITLACNRKYHLKQCRTADFSGIGSRLKYIKGRYVTVRKMDYNLNAVCGAGINFFASRAKAFYYLG